MCVCGENTLSLLCDGKYKYLLRAAWIVLAINTLIDVSAIIAYWQLAPKTLDSKPGLKLSLLLLIAVLFLYMLSALLSCFVIIKLYPKQRESSTESTLNSDRARNDPREGFEDLHHSTILYSDGFRHVLRNNAPPPLPSNRSHQRTNLSPAQTAQNRRTSLRGTTTTSDSGGTNLSTSQSNVESVRNEVPKIVVTEPEYIVPLYEDAGVKSGFPSKSRQGTDDSRQNKPSSLPQGLNHKSLTQCTATKKPSSMLPASYSKICSRNISSNLKPIPPTSNGYSRSIAYQHYEDERQTLEMSMHKTKMESRNGNIESTSGSPSTRSNSYVNRSLVNQGYSGNGQLILNQARMGLKCINTLSTARPAFYGSESNVNKYGANKLNVADPQTLRMFADQTKMSPRNIRRDPTIRSLSARSESCIININMNESRENETKDVELSMNQINRNHISEANVSSVAKSANSPSFEQIRSRFCSVTRNPNSFIAKSQPVINKSNRCTVDNLPPSSNLQTQMLFKAISQTENLFKPSSNQQANSNVQKSDIFRCNVVEVC